MELSLIFAILSLGLYLIGFIPYIYHTYHGKVVPHPFSWTTWCLFGGINTYILLSTVGINWALAPMLIRTIALFIGAFIGWILMRKIQITKFDYIFLILSFLVIGLLLIFGKREAIFAMIFVDLLGLTPTLKKIYLNPESEDSFAWFTSGFSLLFLIFSMPEINLITGLFWIYVISVNFIVGIFIQLWTIKRRTLLQNILIGIKKIRKNILGNINKIIE